jgi:hypothetical protein
MMMLAFMVIFMAGIFFMTRAMHDHRSETVGGVGSAGLYGVDLWSSREHSTPWRAEASNAGHSAFEEYRTQTLQRLDQEQREFQEFMARLRAAKGKEEFEQFMADRRMRPPSPQA